jgi:hypothetical protein
MAMVACVLLQVARRPPYAIETKKVELSGWKRFELDKLTRFVGIEECFVVVCISF